MKLSSTAVLSAASIAFSVPLRAAAKPKHILVLGGTFFLGPAIVEALVADGHEATLFNRGVTNPELFPHLEKLRGHRSNNPEDQDLTALAHRRFDAVIDVWPSDPFIAESAATYLGDRAAQYVYVSSVAAYGAKAIASAGADETAEMTPWDGPARPYNRGKAESERRLRKILGDRLTVVRPGPIKGARDTTPDLLTWLMRARSREIHIGPGDGNDPVEIVDVKDVARFIVMTINDSLSAVFNLTGRAMRFRNFLQQCSAAMRSDSQLVWIPQSFLEKYGLQTDDALGLFAGNFPLWRPPGTRPGLFQISSDKAFGVGWQTRPFEETAWDCLSSFGLRNEHLDWEDYLSERKEKQVLAAWGQSRS
jgi:2'-hydroxyisoflavone reductase